MAERISHEQEWPEEDPDWRALVAGSNQGAHCDPSAETAIHDTTPESFAQEEEGVIELPISFVNEVVYQRFLHENLIEVFAAIKVQVLKEIKEFLLSRFAFGGDIISITESGFRFDIRDAAQTAVAALPEERRQQLYREYIEKGSISLQQDIGPGGQTIKEEFRRRCLPLFRSLAMRLAREINVDEIIIQDLAQQYILLSCIGRGADGNVYLAEDMESGKLYALKLVRFLQHDHDRYKEHRSQFKYEIQILSPINHPNIARYHMSAVADNMGFLVMEWVDGYDAQELLSMTKDGLPLFNTMHCRGAIDIIIDVLNALVFLHHQTPPTVHRDVKPANILVDRMSAKLVDFGIAVNESMQMVLLEETRSLFLGRFIKEVLDEDPGLTQGDPSLFCTPHYTAPETWATYFKPEPSCDVYSAGVTLYQMITRRLPVQGSKLELVTSLMKGKKFPIRPMRDYREDLPEGLDDMVVKRMLAHEPDQRPSADEALDFFVRLRDRYAPRHIIPDTLPSRLPDHPEQSNLKEGYTSSHRIVVNARDNIRDVVS